MYRIGKVILRWRFVIVAAWLVTAGALTIFVPQIDSVAQSKSTSMIPANAPAAQVLTDMSRQFGENTANGLGYLVVERRSGLTAADRRFHDAVLDRAAADRAGVAQVQNLWSTPETAAGALSVDGQAAYTMIRLTADTGTPQAAEAITRLRADVDKAGAPAGLSVHVTGIGPTVADELSGVHTSLEIITLITIVLIALLLIGAYRSFLMSAVPLMTIGLGLGVSRPVVALMGLHGVPLSIFSIALLSALVLGAGTDYAIFLISRFHEQRRAGADWQTAFLVAYSRISVVILASAMVVALTSASMGVAHIGMFRSIGLPSAAGILTVALAAVTLTPALLAIVAERGWAEPKQLPVDRFWQRVARAAVRHPGRTLAGSLAVLLALVAIVPTMALSYDDRDTLRGDLDSSRGYRVVAEHFPANELLPITLEIKSSNDLRTSDGYAVIERVSDAIAGVGGVESVRGISRPLGKPLEQAAVGYQAGVVGDRLDAAVVSLANTNPQMEQLDSGTQRLTDGIRKLNDGATQLAAGTTAAVDGSGRLVTGADDLTAGLGRLASGAQELQTGSQSAAEGARLLRDRIDTALAPTAPALDGAQTLRRLVDANPNCALDPLCSAARSVLAAFDASPLGQVDQLRTGVNQLATGTQQLSTGMAALTSGLTEASGGATQLRDGQRNLNTGLVALDSGAQATVTGTRQLVAGSAPLTDGVQTAKSGMMDLQKGLRQAADYLGELKAHAGTTRNGGFYLPASAMSDPRLAQANKLFFSPDGKTTRVMVVTRGDAFSPAAKVQSEQIADAARRALSGGELQDSTVGLTGSTIVYFDLGNLVNRDLTAIVIVASLLIFGILALMLRSLVAPAYILVSVIISYLAALGLSTLVWQHLLNIPLHWSVPSMSFIALAAVGADYNLLLMTRIREEARDDPQSGTRAAIVRAVSGTGGVITVAAVIFAITMFALLSGSVHNLGQVGFTIGVGLLLDAMIVRTLTIPAVATLLGRWNWWPGRDPSDVTGNNSAGWQAESVDDYVGQRDASLPDQSQDREKV